jgi:ribonuclease P protein component
VGRTATDARRRLTRSADFDAVYRQGRSTASRHAVVYAFPRPAGDGAEATRIGLSVSRRVGGAVERNRLKRQLREALASIESELPRGCDLVVVARAGLPEAVEAQGFAWLAAELRDLAERAARGAAA